MRRNWLMRFTEHILGIFDDDWTWRSGYGCCYRGLLFYFNWILGLYKWLRHGFYDPRREVKGRWSFTVHRIRREAADRALIGCGTFSLLQGRTHWFVIFSYGVFLLYISMWEPRWSAPKGGDDVMAVERRISPMARTWPGQGNRDCIFTTCDLSEIATDNLTYQLLNYITTSTCATVSSHILSYAATRIYGLTPHL